MKEASATSALKIAPTAKGGFLLGNLRQFQRDFLGALSKGFDEHGDIVCFRLGSRVIHAIRHPELAHEVLVSRHRDFHKLRRNQGLGLILGKGLVSNDDHESWLVQRRMMQPIFHRQRIAALCGEMTAAGDHLLARFEEYAATGQSVNLTAEMMRVTLEIITRTMFGEDVSGEAGKVGEATNFLSHFVSNRLRTALPLPLSIPTPQNRAFHQSSKMLDEIIYGIIRRRQTSGEKRSDLLGMLLEARDDETGARMSERQIRDEVLTIFAAGHETTANALSWTWYLLGKHTEAMKTLQQEVDTVLEGRTPELTDIPNLKYVSQVFHESLRLYPPVPMMPRRVEGETSLHGYHIPANSLVFTSIYHIQRHPDLWREPARFDPDRWLPEHARREHQLAFMPFGAGQRLCIGNHMALMEGTLLLAQIAARFEPRLVSPDAVRPDVGVTMTPKNGLPVTIHSRT